MLNSLIPRAASQQQFQPLLLALVAVGLSFGLFTYIQFASPHLVDVDGYYHIKTAALIREQGVPLSFPWLKLTILADTQYADHHMLMHILQIPFTFLGDLRLAAKWSAITFATVAFMTYYFVLCRYEVRYPLLWLLLLFAASPAFLFRMSMPRGQSLSLALQILTFHLLMTRNVVGVALVSAIFVWTYNAFTILLPLVGAALLAQGIATRTLALRLVGAVSVGILIGLIVNPYFPRNILFLWNHIVPKLLASEYATSVGAEWYPYNSWLLLFNAKFAFVAYLGAILITNRDEWAQDQPRTFWALIATLYFVLLCKSRRFIEYFPPAALLFLAFSSRQWVEAQNWTSVFPPKRAIAGIALASLMLVLGGYTTIAAVRSEIATSPPTNRYQGGAAWLAAYTAPGTPVFHTDWDDFPMLFYFNTHNTYLVGLDPDFMRLKDERRFRAWEAITRGEVAAPEDTILNEFGCTYVLTDNEHREFIAVATKSPRMEKVYADEAVTIYRVLPNSLFLPPRR